MKIHLIAVGRRSPAWVMAGFNEYARRLPASCRLELVEVAPLKRTKNQPLTRTKVLESEQLLSSTSSSSIVIALDERGQHWHTSDVARRLEQWLQSGQNISLLIGGADGLSRACLEQAHAHWALSALTLPHALVRVIVAEQIYRAWSLLQHHPYHRE